MAKSVFNDKVSKGDFVVVRESGFRGWVTRISEDADKWPYSVTSPNGNSELAAGWELTVIDLTPKMHEVARAYKNLTEQIEKAKEALFSLEVAQATMEAVMEDEFKEEVSRYERRAKAS